MTVSDQKTGEWVTFPDAQHYQASHRGLIQSLPHKGANGRSYAGTVLKLREDGDGYLVFNYRDDAGVRHTNASVARAVLLAHDPGGFFPGAEACHGDGGQKDNRWPENIRWDTGEANRQEALEKRLANNPPKPKPVKVCPRCQKEHQDRGRNCHECVVQLGVQAARLRAAGVTFREAGDRLGYPPDGLDVLAERYGGLRFYVDEDQVTRRDLAVVHAESPQPKSLSVMGRLKAWLADGDSE